MTAIARRRTRRTIVGATVAVLLMIGAAVMFGVGVVTLSNSQEGEAVGVDDRPVVQFPATPNAMLAVTDEDGELASVVIMTLLPEGQGGSVVTVPVNTDATAGFDSERRPLNASFDADDLPGFVSSVEQVLAITIQRAEVVDAAGLEAMLPDVGDTQLVLANDVIDTRGGGGLISAAGPQTFTSAELVTIITAIDDDQPAELGHANDVVVWESLAKAAPVVVPPEQVPLDDLGRPVAPTSVSELVARMWQGEVSVRDLLVVPVTDVENPLEVDVVVIDRRDSNLVFAQVSPALVTAVNTGPKVRIVANFTDDELESAGALYESSADVAIELIGRLLFLSGNVSSVDTAPTGVPPVTLIEVADETDLELVTELAEVLFGPAEISVAETVTEGVDFQVVLGMSYLEYELDRGTVVTDEPTTSDVAPSTDVPATVDADG
jgi:hypothetical protein